MEKKSKLSRRDSLKFIALGSVGAGMVLTGCEPENKTPVHGSEHQHGSQPEGMTLSPEDQKLMGEKFFTEHELATITVLANLIIPADEHSGNAQDAGVPDFIEFMMKDQPQQQTPIRGGLRWLDVESLKRFEKAFVDCEETQQKQILDDIAWPDSALPENSQGVAFFNRFRDLVATGFWTSKMGIEDLHYMGNVGTVWNGAPPEWLDRLKVNYEG
ncbi:MAG: gluconate 2-dehydrogenase subunit 3 family protein [Bacteroidia bacterium]|nr:gluconate 2-dehydrogenase subunit 3 family protein [Bacteroidia bacterium]